MKSHTFRGHAITRAEAKSRRSKRRQLDFPRDDAAGRAAVVPARAEISHASIHTIRCAMPPMARRYYCDTHYYMGRLLLLFFRRACWADKRAAEDDMPASYGRRPACDDIYDCRESFAPEYFPRHEYYVTSTAMFLRWSRHVITPSRCYRPARHADILFSRRHARAHTEHIAIIMIFVIAV